MSVVVNNNEAVPQHKKIDEKSFDDLLHIAAVIREIAGERAHADVGIICGSGLGELGEIVEDPFVIPYHKIPGFPETNVIGHRSNMIFGTISGKRVVCLQGRFHPYEHDMNLTLCALPVRVMHQLGIKTLIVSNAAGGISEKFQYGDLMMIKDHIFLPALAGFSPMVGLNDDRFGSRFVSVHDAYDRDLRKLGAEVAIRQNLRVFEGIYVMSGGPQYESPAEVTLFKTVGADALGMSTCHEVTVARQCGIKVFGFSLITNIANLDADTSVEVSHKEVIETASEASHKATMFVKEILERMN